MGLSLSICSGSGAGIGLWLKRGPLSWIEGMRWRGITGYTLDFRLPDRYDRESSYQNTLRVVLLVGHKVTFDLADSEAPYRRTTGGTRYGVLAASWYDGAD